MWLFESPCTLRGLSGPVAEPDAPPSVDTHDAVKLVIGLLPSHAGASNVTDAEALPGVAKSRTGGCGAIATTFTVNVVETVDGVSSLSVALHVTVVGPRKNIEPET